MNMEIEDDRAGAPGSPWPANAEFGRGGLEIAGVAAEDLATRYGTPLFVVDEDDVRGRCRVFREAFPRVVYAVKAFTARAVIRIAAEEGLGLLVATGGELSACLRAGVEPSIIAFHGNNKSDDELERAVVSGVGLVVVDNLVEIRRLDRIARFAGRRQPVVVRVVPGVTAGTHAFVETGELGSKFGTPVDGDAALRAIENAAKASGIRLVGLHAHVGSQVLRAGPHLEAVDALLDLAAECLGRLGVTTELLDIGGGFGATYTDESPANVGDLARALLARVRSGAELRGLPVPQVMVEPGRAIAANPVVTLYRVGSVKRDGVRSFVAVDGGMSDNIRPALYGARYTLARANGTAAGPQERFAVVGKHCESGDVLAEGVCLPASMAPGDLLAVAATGAYGYSMASNYNRVGRPAVVAVSRGRSRLWVRRETEEDMERLDVEHPDGSGAGASIIERW